MNYFFTALISSLIGLVTLYLLHTNFINRIQKFQGGFLTLRNSLNLLLDLGTMWTGQSILGHDLGSLDNNAS